MQDINNETAKRQPKYQRHVGLILAIVLAVSLVRLMWQGSAQEFIVAGLAGILPALFWLWFWLKEDTIHPEPKRSIFKAFAFGAIAVPATILLEQAVDILVREAFSLPSAETLPLEGLVPAVAFIMFLLWSAIEECAKLFSAVRADFAEKDYDEPVDAAIYLISAAIGFSALESAFFVWQAILDNGILDGIFLSQLRFMGAGLLHIVSSAFIGLFIGLAFYRSARAKRIFLGLGLLTAILLHAFFNFFIMVGNGSYTLQVFAGLWVMTIAVFFFFEKVKRITPLTSETTKRHVQ